MLVAVLRADEHRDLLVLVRHFAVSHLDHVQVVAGDRLADDLVGGALRVARRQVAEVDRHLFERGVVYSGVTGGVLGKAAAPLGVGVAV